MTHDAERAPDNSQAQDGRRLPDPAIVDFWAATSLDTLVAQQGTGVIRDPSTLALEGISEPEWDAFYAAIEMAG